MVNLDLGSILSMASIILFIIYFILGKIFKSKIDKYDKYIKFVIGELAKKADESFDKNSDKHLWVSEKIYSYMPMWLKLITPQDKIDEYIHYIVHKIRNIEEANSSLITQAVITANNQINNDDLSKIVTDIKNKNKVSLSANLNVEDFKKSVFFISAPP